MESEQPLQDRPHRPPVARENDSLTAPPRPPDKRNKPGKPSDLSNSDRTYCEPQATKYIGTLVYAAGTKGSSGLRPFRATQKTHGNAPLFMNSMK